MKDPHKFYQSVLGIVPPKFRTDFQTLTKIANQQLGAFLKGQIIASFILGAVYWVTFLLIGLEFASILAIAAGILCIIPYIGPFYRLLPWSIYCLSGFNVYGDKIYPCLVYRATTPWRSSRSASDGQSFTDPSDYDPDRSTSHG